MSAAPPTVTVTSVAASKAMDPSRVAVTRAVFAPPSSATESCTSVVPVSASTVSVSAVGAVSSSVMAPVAAPAPWAVETVALVGAPSVTVTVSLPSLITSPLTGTTMSASVLPAAISTERGFGRV